MKQQLLQSIIAEDERRLAVLNETYNAITGENAPGLRAVVTISDLLDGQKQYIPVEMFQEDFILALINAGSVERFIELYLPTDTDFDVQKEQVIRYYVRLRCKHDFYFFAYVYAKIKNKEGGPDIPFILRPAQLKLCRVLEEMRLKGVPIRVILLKARQWGGSTLLDIYMGWIQIFWKTHWDSNIVGHQSTSSSNVFEMYERLINALPDFLFYELGESYPTEGVKKFAGVGTSQNIKKMVPRNCNIQTGSARNPESTRSAAAAMVHLTEDAFFPNTETWTPQKVINAAISAVPRLPYSFIARESTPNGKNHFYDAWVKAKKGKSAYVPVFVAWFEIEKYMSPMTEDERVDFIINLWENRNNKAEHGDYFWWLWNNGASLEGIKWYIEKLGEYDTLEDMQQEYPSDDIEAFRFSGNIVFDGYKLDIMEKEDTYDPIFEGDIEGDSILPDAPDNPRETPPCMKNIHLVEQCGGPLRIWEEPDDTEMVENRYIIAVDIGGAHNTSDFYDMVVFDRYDLMFGGCEAVVAEWHGHLEPDQAAMKAAQLAVYYNDANLVVENNTAYSKMNNTEGNISQLFFPILIPLYRNVYSGNSSKLLKRRQKETKWGFNTNESTKPALIKNLVKLVRDHNYIEREKEAIVEMSYYLFFRDRGGKYGGAPGYHDDRVMARAIGLFVSRLDMDAPYIVQQKSPDDIRREYRQRITEAAPPELGRL